MIIGERITRAELREQKWELVNISPDKQTLLFSKNGVNFRIVWHRFAETIQNIYTWN